MRTVLRAALALAVLCGASPWPASPASPNHFRFSIVGDRTGEAQPGVYERVWREVNQFHPDFVINVGDVIEGGNDATADQEWRTVREVWRDYSYPLYFTPGNHDIWSDTSEKLYEKYSSRPPSYSFNYQDAHFTILD